MTTVSEHLFDPGDPKEPEPGLSYTARLTERRRRLLDAGVHPATRARLRGGPETCGDCAHFLVRSFAKTYFKCAVAGDTASEATDIRKSWPSCELFAGRGD